MSRVAPELNDINRTQSINISNETFFLLILALPEICYKNIYLISVTKSKINGYFSTEITLVSRVKPIRIILTLYSA